MQDAIGEFKIRSNTASSDLQQKLKNWSIIVELIEFLNKLKKEVQFILQSLQFKS